MIYFFFKKIKISLLLTLLYIPFVYGNSLSPLAYGETPASLACIYGLTAYLPGCKIQGTTAVPMGGSGAIVIIDGQDDPNALAEIQLFHSQFFPGQFEQCNADNTNQPCFQRYYTTPSGANPCVVATTTSSAHSFNIDDAIDIEPEIDIEWAHAMAPNASIYMVITQGWLQTLDPNAPNTTGLINGLLCAKYLLQTYNGGRGIVSYSNSASEWAGETAIDAYYQTPGIIYIASAGDYSAPARYPSTSPYVIAAGGTSVRRDALGNYIDQVWWDNGVGHDCNPICKTGASGGPSRYEARPVYQNSVQKIVGTQRGTPDISFAARNINVFCCQIPSSPPNYQGNNCCGGTSKFACQSIPQCTSGGIGAWVISGGTSLASPALAGIINSAHSGASSTAEELSIIYNGAIKNYPLYWTDILSGNNGYPALRGYDFTSGLGVPRGYGGK